MPATIMQQRIQQLADMFLEQDFSVVKTYCAESLVAYLAGKPEVDLNRDAIARLMENLREAAIAAGTLSIRSTVPEVQQQGGARFSARIHWEYLGPNEKVLEHSDFTLFCAPNPTSGFQVEMIELHRIAFVDWPGRDIPLIRH